MSTLTYHTASRTNGDTIATNKGRWTESLNPRWVETPADWSLILPDDQVIWNDPADSVGKPATVLQSPDPNPTIRHKNVPLRFEDGTIEWVDANDITLVCANPSRLRQSNQAWMWPT